MLDSSQPKEGQRRKSKHFTYSPQKFTTTLPPGALALPDTTPTHSTTVNTLKPITTRTVTAAKTNAVATMSSSITRRNATTGTIDDLTSLAASHPGLRSPYSYHVNVQQLMRRYKLMEVETMRRHFIAKRWTECREVALTILSGKVSDMILARAAMILAEQEVEASALMRA
jgi:hypothetical protein